MNKKYFGTDGIRGKVGGSSINPEFVLKLGWAVGQVLTNGERGKILIGKDTRISGYMLESALEAGLSAAGIDIHLLGPMPTPAIAYLTRTLRAKAGIVISASHNPHHDNGIKFFSDEGRKFPDDLECAVEEQMNRPMETVSSEKLGKAMRVDDAPGRYIEFCKSTVPSNTRLTGMKIVVDCANGATYHIAPYVFQELGADVITIGDEPNGFNINADCGSTHPNLLQQTVLAEQADLGLALDGDGDRVIMVDSEGTVLDGDELLFIIAKNCFQRGTLKGGVIGTVMSNLGLEIGLKELGIDFVRTPVGDRHIIEELYRRDWQLGGECSGHIVHLGATTSCDGIVAALHVLSALCHSEYSLAELKSGMTKFPQALFNVRTMKSADVLNNPQIQKAVRDVELELADRGRVLLRPSGTEPVIRVMVEGRDLTQVDVLAKQLADAVTEVAES